MGFIICLWDLVRHLRWVARYKALINWWGTWMHLLLLSLDLLTCSFHDYILRYFDFGEIKLLILTLRSALDNIFNYSIVAYNLTLIQAIHVCLLVRHYNWLVQLLSLMDLLMLLIKFDLLLQLHLNRIHIVLLSLLILNEYFLRILIVILRE